jgi:hypothetical protein
VLIHADTWAAQNGVAPDEVISSEVALKFLSCYYDPSVDNRATMLRLFPDGDTFVLQLQLDGLPVTTTVITPSQYTPTTRRRGISGLKFAVRVCEEHIREQRGWWTEMCVRNQTLGAELAERRHAEGQQGK